jgi:ABC-2 type transport system permease protein
VALQRFAALAATLGLVGAVLWLVMLVISGPAGLEGISATEFAAAAAHLVLLGACIGGLAFAVGAATGRKALALGVSAGVAVLAYLANGVFPQVPGLEWTRQVSPWHRYLGGEPLRHGLQVGDALLGVTAVLVVAGTWFFHRRDIAA